MQPEDFEKTKRSSGPLRLIAFSAAGFILLGALAVAAGNCAVQTGGTPAAASPLQISEYMSSNNAVPDSAGTFSDWVEVTNAGDTALSLKGYALESAKKTGMLPDRQLQPGECAVIYCDGLGREEGRAAFRLKAAGGEELLLKDPAGKTVDATTTIALETNVSAVRGEGIFSAAARYTPGYPNTDEGYAAYMASRQVSQSALVLSEILAANTVTLADADGQFADVIEIRNDSKETIQLERYGLSNDKEQPLKWQFPKRELKPGETLLVFASGKGHSSDARELHAPFKLDKAADTVVLAAPDGRILDSVEINGLDNDIALVRGGDGQWSRTAAVSPGYPNTAEGMEAFWKAQDASRTGLRINEVMTRNNTIVCIGGRPYDWVELYNPTDKPISLKGYTLSNDTDTPGRFALPDKTVPAGGYLVIYCTGETVDGGTRYIQANFKLNGGDGAVALYKDGNMADGVSLSGIPIDCSKGRRETGGAGFWLFTKPTLGAANGGGGERDRTATPVAATKPGIYNGVQKVEVALSGEGAVYYTLDGSAPTTASARYTGPFAVTATTAVRAIAVKPGAVPSDILTASYIVNENHQMDVVSLTSPPDGLFGYEKGIYAVGKGQANYPNEGANFMQHGYAWERAAHVELFPQDKEEAGFSVGCGVRIFGGMSRTYQKKSLTLKFRDSYGASQLVYPVFASRDNRVFDNLLLRSGGQDWAKAIMKDVLTTSLADDTDILANQAYRPVVLYINGAYWGIHYIREKINEGFIAANANVSEDSVNLLVANGRVGAGSEDYQALISYIKAHSPLNAEAYRYVCDRMDVTSFADYLITEMYCGNKDSGNIRWYRSSETDNKWRWILYDTDITYAAGENWVWFLIDPAGTGTGQNFSTALINGLLTSGEFRQLFLERLKFNMQNTFRTDKVLARIDELSGKLKPEIARNYARWEISRDWNAMVAGIRSFVEKRPATLKQEFLDARVAAKFQYTAQQLDDCFAGQ